MSFGFETPAERRERLANLEAQVRFEQAADAGERAARTAIGPLPLSLEEAQRTDPGALRELLESGRARVEITAGELAAGKYPREAEAWLRSGYAILTGIGTRFAPPVEEAPPAAPSSPGPDGVLVVTPADLAAGRFPTDLGEQLKAGTARLAL